MFSIVPYFLVSKSVLVKIHSVENNRNFAVGEQVTIQSGLSMSLRLRDSGLYVAAKIVQLEIILGDYDPGAVRGHYVKAEKGANSVEDRAESWRETKF